MEWVKSSCRWGSFCLGVHVGKANVCEGWNGRYPGFHGVTLEWRGMCIVLCFVVI